MFKVYVCQAKPYYYGVSFIAASTAEEANQIIKEFRESDPGNFRDSRGYSSVDESNVINDLTSSKVGIIYYGIFYSG